MWETLAYIAAGIIATIMNNRSNKDLMEEQQAYNTSMLDKENEYNSPVQQVARLKAAGVNPTSVGMSNGQIQGGQSAQALPTNLLPMTDPLLNASNSALSAMTAFKSQTEGEDILSTREERKRLITNQANVYRSTAQNYDLKNVEQEIVNQYADMRELWAANNMKSSSFKNYAEARNFQASFKKQTYELEHILPADLLKILADTGISIWNQQLVMAQIAETYTRSDKNVAEAHESEARAGLAEAQTGLTEQQTKTELQRTEGERYETGIKRAEYGNANDLQAAYLRQYNAATARMEAETDLTKEEIYWKVFDEMDKTSLTVFGNKVHRGRFGERMYRKATKQAFKEKLPY